MRIVVGITGGIAAYKAVGLVRLLVEAGHDVKVIPTRNALRFVGSTTLEAISHNTVDEDLYTDVEQVKHVSLGQEAELIIVAPATAAFLARLATGLADDLLMNTILASKAKVFVAPAMHTEMWDNPATAKNIETLRARGIIIIGPEIGRLTGEDTGAGRMTEPQQIFDQIFSPDGSLDLSGKTICVTAGGTREPIDTVRFIGNRSSGKQGLAIAKAAKARGAKVILIAANVSEDLPGDAIRVSTVSQLDQALEQALPQIDALVMAAAVSDFQLEAPHEGKIKKQVGAKLELTLVQTPDLLAKASSWLNQHRPGSIVVGFAAETSTSESELADLGRSKLESKGCDLIVANSVKDGAVFDSDSTAALLIGKEGLLASFSGSKEQLAHRLLDIVVGGLN